LSNNFSMENNQTLVLTQMRLFATVLPFKEVLFVDNKQDQMLLLLMLPHYLWVSRQSVEL
jgi:hypothetical protein